MAVPSVVGAVEAEADGENTNMLAEARSPTVKQNRKAGGHEENTGSRAWHFAKLTAQVLLGLLLVSGLVIYPVNLGHQLHQIQYERSANAELASRLTALRNKESGMLPSGGVSLPMVSLFGANPVLEAIKARKSWFRTISDKLDKMNPSVATSGGWQRYDFFGPVFNLCPTRMQSFGAGDQEKRVCDLAKLTKLSDGKCEIISLGSEGRWDFEREIFHRTSCRVHTFDCTGTFPAPPDLRSRVFSYPYCIGAERIGGKYKPYSELLHIAGVNSAPTFFKIDVEGFEWNVFPEVFSTSRSLLPDQIGFEIHYHRLASGLGWWKDMKNPADIALFGEIFYQAGYVPIDRRDNRHGVPGEATEYLMAKVL